MLGHGLNVETNPRPICGLAYGSVRPDPMISEEEARNAILQFIRPLLARQVLLNNTLGCFAAQDYLAHMSLPVFDNSAMDGYAVIASDCRSNAGLSVIGEQPAGVDRQLHVRTGEAIRIFTGAPIPSGADAVVMQEDVTRESDKIVVNVDVSPGEFIRKRGCDLSEGQKILAKGERIRATTLALLASQGIADLMIGGEVSASILSTGDELATPGTKLKLGQIYESNSILLMALLQCCGASLKSSEHCRDDRDSLRKAIERGIKNQVLIITGGVSVGEHDLVREVLHELGAKIDIWRVAIKPGKPFLFGRVGECIILGLPGNPVSAFVTFLKFVRPAILKMMGASERELGLREVSARLAMDLSNEGDRVHYVRGQLEAGQFMSVGRQESHALFGLSQANALVRLDPGAKLETGASVIAEMWD